jgi:hypothetical protein
MPKFTQIADDTGAAAKINTSLPTSNDPALTVRDASQGQATMANSRPVVIASDQSAITVAQATASNLNAQIVGNIAHDAVDSGNPVKIGGHARQTNPTAVANNDRTDIMTDDIGRVVVVNSHVRDLVITANVSLTNTTETTLLAAGGVGVFHDLVQLVITNSSTTPVDITVRDATAGTIRAIFCLARGGSAAGTAPIFILPLNTPWPQTTADNNWTVQASAAVSTVRIFAMAVKNV